MLFYFKNNFEYRVLNGKIGEKCVCFIVIEGDVVNRMICVVFSFFYSLDKFIVFIVLSGC